MRKVLHGGTLAGMKIVRIALLSLPFLGSACRCVEPNYEQPLAAGAAALLPLDAGDVVPDFAQQWHERDEILPALEKSLGWMRRKHATKFYPIEGITHGRALASLERMHELLRNSRSASEFGRAVRDEFDVFKSAGWNGRGDGVLFTGYCTPVLPGSTKKSAEYAHPLYALPADLEKGPQGEILGRRTAAGALEPYPTRGVIEASSLLSGKELIWLRDPIDAYIAHVNGSAVVRLPDDELVRFGYAGKNGQPYSSLGKALIAEGELPADGVSLRAIREWADKYPNRVQRFLDRNESYIFFASIDGNPHGSLDVEVTGGRSLATDKTIFPRGGIVYVDTRLSIDESGQGWPYQRFMFDQDTGGAIRTAGRADIYVGVGDEAERLAGSTRSEGQLYYLFLRQDLPRP